jgi:hypothetical protein
MQLDKNITTDVSKHCVIFIFRMKQSQSNELLKLLKFGDEQNTILRTANICQSPRPNVQEHWKPREN